MHFDKKCMLQIILDGCKQCKCCCATNGMLCWFGILYAVYTICFRFRWWRCSQALWPHIPRATAPSCSLMPKLVQHRLQAATELMGTKSNSMSKTVWWDAGHYQCQGFKANLTCRYDCKAEGLRQHASFNGFFFVHDGFMKRWCWSASGHRCAVWQNTSYNYMVQAQQQWAKFSTVYLICGLTWLDAHFLTQAVIRCGNIILYTKCTLHISTTCSSSNFWECFQCIALPNRTLHGWILYLTGICISLYATRRVKKHSMLSSNNVLGRCILVHFRRL